MNERRRRQLLRGVVVAIQAILLTIAVGALIVHADNSLEGLVTPRISFTPLFGGAFLAAVLMGLTVRKPIVLYPLVLLMSLGAASMLTALLLAPTWSGTIGRTNALENFATTRAFLFAGLVAVPMLIGALAGNLLSNLVGEWGEILPPIRDSADEMPSWWERRGDE